MTIMHVGARIGCLVLFCSLLPIMRSHAQSDSLLQALKQNPQRDSTRVLILNQLAFANYYNNPVASLNYGFESLNLADSLHFTRGQADAFRQIGLSFWAQADMPTAMNYFLSGLRIAETNHHVQVEADITGNIGTTYTGLGNPTEALIFLQKSRDMQQALKNQWREASVLNNMGDAYQALGNLDKAKEAYTLALQFSREKNYKLGISTNVRNIGNLFEKKGLYDSALANYFQCIQLSTEIHDNRGVILSNKSIANVYLKKGATKLAEQFARTAMDAAVKGHLRAFMRDTYELMGRITEMQGNKSKALEYYKLFTAYKDSVQNLRVVSDVATHRLRFETEKKQNEIELLKKDRQLQESRIENQNLKIYFISAVLVLALVLVYAVVRNYRRVKRVNALLAEKNSHIGKQNLKLSEQHDELTALNEEIRSQQEETMAQRDELFEKNQEIEKMSGQLREVNNNLEKLVHQRTAQVEERNKKLAEYLHFNAHQLRAPVASILGLINVFQQTSSFQEKEEVISMLEKSSQNLDGVIKSINNSMEEGLDAQQEFQVSEQKKAARKSDG